MIWTLEGGLARRGPDEVGYYLLTFETSCLAMRRSWRNGRGAMLGLSTSDCEHLRVCHQMPGELSLRQPEMRS